MFTFTALIWTISILHAWYDVNFALFGDLLSMLMMLISTLFCVQIKYEGTLRRWVVPEEALNQLPFSLTVQALESKIRDLFNLTPSTPLNITYIDKENDVVTLGDDQDLIDACIIQQLNPLRLEVQVLSEKQNDKGKDHGNAKDDNDDKNADPNNNGTNIPNVDIETLLKALFPQATLDSVKSFLQTQEIDVRPQVGSKSVAFKDHTIFAWP